MLKNGKKIQSYLHNITYNSSKNIIKNQNYLSQNTELKRGEIENDHDARKN